MDKTRRKYNKLTKKEAVTTSKSKSKKSLIFATFVLLFITISSVAFAQNSPIPENDTLTYSEDIQIEIEEGLKEYRNGIPKMDIKDIDSDKVLKIDSEVQEIIAETTKQMQTKTSDNIASRSISQDSDAKWKQLEEDARAKIISSENAGKLGLGFKSPYCIKAGGEYLPTIIVSERQNDWPHKKQISWLYEITTGNGLNIKNSSGYVNDLESSRQAEFDVIAGQYFYFPIMPNEINNVTDYISLKDLGIEIDSISDAKLVTILKETYPDGDYKIPSFYDYWNVDNLA